MIAILRTIAQYHSTFVRAIAIILGPADHDAIAGGWPAGRKAWSSGRLC
jgi:hypothetical protein